MPLVLSHRVLIAFGLIWLVAVYALVSVPQQSDFDIICIAFLTSFISYFTLISFEFPIVQPSRKKIDMGSTLLWLIIIGLLARVGAIFHFPHLSDDIYRFIWDGRLIHDAYNPYAHLPSTIIDSLLWEDRHILLEKMNSPNYYTVYPPVSQLVFYLSSWSFLGIFGASIVMKTIFLVFEAVTLIFGLRILRLLSLSPSLILLYWLNPLIVVEGIGNLHFEIAMISMLVVSLYFFQTGKLYKALFFLALSVASKLLTLLALPYILWKFRHKNTLRLLIHFTICSLLVFSPLLLGLHQSEFMSSIDLYFRKFEFNASIYYLLRTIGHWISGYNLIQYLGPILASAFVFIFLYRLFKSKASNIYSHLYWALIIYFMLATTVHPWYLSVPILCSVFIKDRIAIVWSSVIWLSYINYSYDPYFENMYIVALEYVLVLSYIIYQYYLSKK